ncbi:hypothetical protein AB0M20_24615, partial [Actinoplanes sp. NPDC051633]|uniref:hypothetical protein n=1 Tax=Actinoplanes sp. NPDC051633 TaxID=3155670 RepID=UPI00343F528A
ELAGEPVHARSSEALDAFVAFTQAAGGPAAAAVVVTQAIKTTGDVLIAKINAGSGNKPDAGGGSQPEAGAVEK